VTATSITGVTLEVAMEAALEAMFVEVVVVVDVPDVGRMSTKVAVLSLVALSLLYTVSFWVAFAWVKTKSLSSSKRVYCACIIGAQHPAFLCPELQKSTTKLC
jgi:phosphate/sulfate permease